ncbi:MAG: P-II family nitrogen regulator [Gemmataceae bacterium]
MKLIVAIIRPYHLEFLQKALEENGITPASIVEVVTGEHDPGYKLVHQGREIQVRRAKYRIDLMVDDWVVEKVVRLIVVSTAAGCPGGISDAKIMLVPVQDCSPTAGGRPATPTNRIGALCSA